MARTLQFTIPGDVDTIIHVEEILNPLTGLVELHFSVAADETSQQADLRGLFFDLSDASVLGTLSVAGADVTDSQFQENAVTDLGQGANMNGAHTSKGRGFDAGIEIGTPGQAKDDIDTTNFVLASNSGDLSLDLIGLMRFGVRYTSVGPEGARNDSLKIVGIAPAAPDAVDDAATTDEDTSIGFDILANDTDADGDPLLVVSTTAGSLGTPVGVVSDGGRNGQLTVNSDGTVLFDPAGGFEDLGTGETDTISFTYVIDDGNGGSDMADVTITVAGVNDAPEALDDGPFFVESADLLTADVLANDTDPDSAIVPATLSFGAAAHGTASAVLGLLQYTADDIGGDTTDDSVSDVFQYTVADDEGAPSNPANVTVNVIDPLIESFSDSAAATSNGQLLTLALQTEDRTYNTSSFVSIAVDAGALDQTPVNVSFVLDGSGSVSSSEYAQQRLAVQNAINELRTDFAGTGTPVTVQLVQFSSNSNQAVYNLFDPALNNVATGTPISSQLFGGTNYDPPLSQASTFFSTRAGQDNFLLFASDGEPNPGTPAFSDEVLELNGFGVSITAVGFGSGVSLSTLNTIDNTGGAQNVASAAQLGSVFAASPLFPADLIEFKLTVDGVDQGIGVGDLTSLGGGDYALNDQLLGLDNSDGATNTVVATAFFDVDKDGVADEIRSAQTIIDGTDGSGILFA